MLKSWVSILQNCQKGDLAIKYSIHQRTGNFVCPRKCNKVYVKPCYGKTVKLGAFSVLFGVPGVMGGVLASWSVDEAQ